MIKTALLISTYNWPEALNLVLKSALRQSVLPDEILIADDGSAEETKELIMSFQKKTSIPVKHFWQEDKGFRKSKILNQAVAHSTADYIVETDGDCILHKHFIKDHIRNAKPGLFLYGVRSHIKKEYLNEVFQKGKVKYNIFSKEVSKKKRAIHFPLINKLYKQTNRYNRIIGCNISFWRRDFVAINGYQENYEGWGPEDVDLALRFIKYGLSPFKLNYSGIIYHMWHAEREKDRFELNWALFEKEKEKEGYFCENGIDKYLNV